MADEMTPEEGAAAREGFLGNPAAVAYSLLHASAGETGTAVVNVGGERCPVRVMIRGGAIHVEVWRMVGGSWVRIVLQPAPDGTGLGVASRHGPTDP